MRVLVCGGREYADAARVTEVLDAQSITVIIEGCARGADSLAEDYARTHRIPVRHFPADWERNGKAAGHIRNREMLVQGRPDLVIAFPGGRGTANMVGQARLAGVRVIEVGVALPATRTRGTA